MSKSIKEYINIENKPRKDNPKHAMNLFFFWLLEIF